MTMERLAQLPPTELEKLPAATKEISFTIVIIRIMSFPFESLFLYIYIHIILLPLLVLCSIFVPQMQLLDYLQKSSKPDSRVKIEVK